MKTRANRLDVDCPVCFMPRGRFCRDKQGYSMKLGHPARLIASRVREAVRVLAAPQEGKEENRG